MDTPIYNDEMNFATGITRPYAAPREQGASRRREPLREAFWCVLFFLVVYFARPEDWVPGFSHIPLAKITGTLALVALGCSIGQFRQRIPREVFLLFLFVGQLFVASLMSPIWPGGAVLTTLNFSKILLIVPLIIGVVTTSRRLRLLVFSQAVSVAVVASVVIWNGHSRGGRLGWLLGGNYTDPNDLALTIVLSLPLSLALLFLSRTMVGKILWSVSMLVMAYVIFLTGSRTGFIALIAVASICLWEFAIRGHRRYLLLVTAVAGLGLWQYAGGELATRFKETFNPSDTSTEAYKSYEARQQLFWRSVEVTEEHPIFGVGPGNFDQVSGLWHTTHNSITLLSSEAGIPALVLYALILWCGLKNLRTSMRLSRGQKESYVLARALYASFWGYLIGSLFLSWGYLFLPYILVAYTSCLRLIVRKSAVQTQRDLQAANIDSLFSMA